MDLGCSLSSARLEQTPRRHTALAARPHRSNALHSDDDLADVSGRRVGPRRLASRRTVRREVRFLHAGSFPDLYYWVEGQKGLNNARPRLLSGQDFCQGSVHHYRDVRHGAHPKRQGTTDGPLLRAFENSPTRSQMMPQRGQGPMAWRLNRGPRPCMKATAGPCRYR